MKTSLIWAARFFMFILVMLPAWAIASLIVRQDFIKWASQRYSR